MRAPDKPAPLMPKADRVWIVRWVREDGNQTRNRTFLRRHPAESFLGALLEDGRTAAMFSASTDWEAS